MKNEKSKFLIYEKSTRKTVDNKKKFSIKNYCKPSASLTTNSQSYELQYNGSWKKIMF